MLTRARLAAPVQLSLDPTTLALGVAGGAAVGVAVSYFVFFNRAGRTKVQVVQRDSSGQLRKKTITTEELDASKREMRTLILERDLLSSALTKIYEAESDGQITREEREMIARRYSGQIREFEAKLRDKELVVEVGELEGLRDELVSLFREKIQNIESRLDQARERLQPMRQELRPEPPRSVRSSRHAAPQPRSAVSALRPTTSRGPWRGRRPPRGTRPTERRGSRRCATR